MIFEKKINIIFNKKNKISTAYLNIPIKGIKIMNEPKILKCFYNQKNNEIILKKDNEGQPLIVQANGNSKLYRFTLDKEIIEKTGYKKNQLVKIDITTEQIKINFNQEEKMSKIISIINFKGGVGKTFLTVQLSVGLSLIGKKVLILTSDSQNNVLDYTAPQEHKPIFDSGLKAFVKGEDGDIVRIRENVDFIPLEDSKFSTTFLNNLPKFIEKMKIEYDFVLIDSIPTMKLDTIFVECSDKVIIPCFCDRVTVEGVINVVEEAGIDKVFSIIVNKYRNTTNQNKYLNDLKNVLGETTILLPEPIKELSQIETLLEKGKSVWETNSKGLQEVQDSLIEVIKGM